MTDTNIKHNMQRASIAYDLDLYIDRHIDMACEAALSPQTGKLSEAVSEELIEGLISVDPHKSIEPLSEYLFAGGTSDQDVIEQIDEMPHAARHLMGICLRAVTPVRRFGEHGSATFSWGYYKAQWVYGQTYEDAWQQAVEWAEAQATPPAEHQ